ncbi:MAG: serine/threonine protein kinase [Chloroflexi bacterium]|nr:serine/threonine protein kinase [Chloroflexota bacterium]
MTAERIGRYKIIKQLGHGGMATVFLGHDPLIRREVAIKVMSAQLMTDPAFFDRFQNEAETIANLEHPSIVPIYDFGHQGDQSYIVMRYMNGGALEDRLEKGPMKLQTIAPIIERMAAALDEAHRKNIIHRDIKPANILFNSKGEAFLSDFGIAKNTEGGADLTADNTFIGTVEYMSPEQIQGNQKLDGRADVYALGIVLFLMLTGQLPFKKDTVVYTIMAHLTEPIPSVQEQLPQSRLPWDDILNKTLAKDPADRYAMAGDLAKDVNSLLSGKWYLNKLLD